MNIEVKNNKVYTFIGKPLDDYIREKHNQDRCMGFIDGYNKAKENTYTEEEIDKLLSFYTDDAPASYIKRDYKKYLQSLKQHK